MRTKVVLLIGCLLAFCTSIVRAADVLKPGDPAPLFTTTTDTGAAFDLASRKGRWTVLYFYPKAGTPGCTTQAGSYRDNLTRIHEAGAEVYGVSTDTVERQAAFAADNHLGFTLLADPEGKVVEAYGAKMPILTMARRWTFIIGPDLTIQHIERDVNPALDAPRVAAEIQRLKGTPAPQPQP